MLRRIVAVVLLLNIALGALVWAVDQGHVVWPDAWRGVSREPERLTRQIKPEAMLLKPAATAKPGAAAQTGLGAASSPGAASSAPATPTSAASAALAISDNGNSAPAKAAAITNSATLATVASVASVALASAVSPAAQATKTLCLQSKDNDAAIASKLATSFKEQLPGATVQTFISTNGGLWMVYMGKYADINAATKKLAEVKGLKIPGDFALIRNTAGLQPGISLGAFRSKEAANTRLQEVGKKGVKTARVVEVTAPKELNTVKLPELDQTLRAKADEAAKKAGGKALEVCTA
jgi:hypothetical protein